MDKVSLKLVFFKKTLQYMDKKVSFLQRFIIQMRKEKNHKKKQKSKNYLSKGLARYKQVSLINGTARRQIVLDTSVYANYSNLTTSGSYSLGTNVSASLIYRNLLADLATDSEFVALKNIYTYFKFSKIGVRVIPTTMYPSGLTDLPDLYLLVNSDNSPTSRTKETIAKMDLAFPVKLNQQDAVGPYLNVLLPKFAQGPSGYNFGSEIWFLSGTTSWTSANVYLFIGSRSEPTFTGLASNVNFRVASLEVIFDVTFANPY